VAVAAIYFGVMLPQQACYAIDIASLSKGDEDEIMSDVRRPCEERSAVAAEWYNRYPLRSDNSQPQKHVVSANIFINGAAVTPADKSNWSESNLFGNANRFLWKFSGIAGDSFDKDGCQFDESNEPSREVRRGVRLLSEPRSNPGLTRDKWEECNRMPYEDPKYSYCKWIRFEVFIPTLIPRNWCLDRSDENHFFWRGARKKYLVPSMPNAELTKASRSTWEKGHEINVPEDTWKKWTQGMPKLCMRAVGLDGQYLSPVESKWEELGVIGAAWCDH
jgi:hypothetical protein